MQKISPKKLTAPGIALPSLLLAVIALLTPASFAVELEGGFEIVQLADMTWDESSDRVQQKILYGNPAEEGLYIIRVRFPGRGHEPSAFPLTGQIRHRHRRVYGMPVSMRATTWRHNPDSCRRLYAASSWAQCTMTVLVEGRWSSRFEVSAP
jgi:hypothetical protein